MIGAFLYPRLPVLVPLVGVRVRALGYVQHRQRLLRYWQFPPLYSYAGIPWRHEVGLWQLSRLFLRTRKLGFDGRAASLLGFLSVAFTPILSVLCCNFMAGASGG